MIRLKEREDEREEGEGKGRRDEGRRNKAKALGCPYNLLGAGIYHDYGCRGAGSTHRKDDLIDIDPAGAGAAVAD